MSVLAPVVVASAAPVAPPEMLSRYISRAEFEKSATATRLGIANRMPAAELSLAKTLCRRLVDPLREVVGPIHVNSGYRSPALNRAIGGSTTSDHMRGRAIDVETWRLPGLPPSEGGGGLSTRELFDVVRWLRLSFDQLILEYPSDADPRAGWVHIGYRSGPGPAQTGRGQVLVAGAGGYRTFSAPILVTEAMREVVKGFQRRAGFTGNDVDGIVGPMTRRAAGVA